MIWIGSAGVLAALGLVRNSADLLVVSALISSAGLLARVPALIASWARSTVALDESRFNQLESHLRVTEDELAWTTRELNALKEKREFDVELLLSKSRPTQDR